jgi:hypothetical protein
MAQSILRSSFISEKAVLGRSPGLAANRSASAAPSTISWLLRGGLVLGCLMAVAIAAWLGDPSGYLHADPALARLLRAMALIKASIVIAAAGAVFWRLGWPVSKPVAASYLVACWVIAGSTMLIWQLSYIVPAALLFHSAALCLILVSWRER